MQLSSLPPQALSANRDVLGSLQRAATDTQAAQQRLQSHTNPPAGTARLLTSALGHAQDAVAGAASLGSTNVLEGTFNRYAGHAVRHLRDAVALLERGSSLGPDARTILADHVFDAEVATRLGSAAGERSLRRPTVHAAEHAGSAHSDESTSPSSSTVVDGVELDALGNPTRGAADEWAGPDGQRFVSDGGASDSGGYVGPDGESFSGI
ncbi:MAG: hypothetical protein JWM86_2875 [Thermoleophilia bacterium]|nr:hypothetical protein [Thermoleophilia bacterium]